MKIPFILAASAISISGHFAMAAGSSDSKPPVKSPTTKACNVGYVWDVDKKECIAIENIKDTSLSVDRVYLMARALAYDNQYENALSILSLAPDQNDPRILNYKGYTNRKLGRIEVGMKYYQLALDVDPNYDLARSYYGQALIQDNRHEEAQQQLIVIASNGGKGSWPYMALKAALSGNTTTDY
jgi:tetratricopeptide (TPR) repeat protein